MGTQTRDSRNLAMEKYSIKQPTEVLQQHQTAKETLVPDVTFSSPLFRYKKISFTANLLKS